MRWLLWDQEPILPTVGVSSYRNLTSVWYYYSIRRVNLRSPGFLVGSDTFQFSDKCPLGWQWFDRVGGTPAEGLANGFHEKLKDQEAGRICARTSRWKGNSQIARDLWQRKRFQICLWHYRLAEETSADHRSQHLVLTGFLTRGRRLQ